MRPKSRGLKRQGGDVDVLFPGPESYRKEKKQKPNECDIPPIGDNTSENIAPSDVEKRWNSSQIHVIKPSTQNPKKSKNCTTEIPSETFSKKSSAVQNMGEKNKQERNNTLNKNDENGDNIKKRKDKFLNEMVTAVEKKEENQSDNNIVLVGDAENWTNFYFHPLTKQQRIQICKRIGLIYRKDIENTSCGEKLGRRSPIIRIIKGDSNCFFRSLSVSVTGWEVGHLAIRKLVCDHINTVGPYTKHVEGKYYLNESKMKKAAVYATDIEIMAAAQVFGADIYVYGYSDGKTGHFDYVTGLL